MEKLWGGLFAAVLLLSIPGAGQAARAPGAQTRVPVTVVLVERLPVPGAPFVIHRRPDMVPRDVIVVRTDATADQLSEAVRSLLSVRQVSGDTAATQSTMRMRRQSAAGQKRRALRWVQRVLSDLRLAAEKDVPGIGRGRAVEIWLPPQTRRGGPR